MCLSLTISIDVNSNCLNVSVTIGDEIGVARGVGERIPSGVESISVGVDPDIFLSIYLDIGCVCV